MNLKWIINLNVKYKTMKLLEDLDDLVFGCDFLYTTPKIRSMKRKIAKLDIKIKTSTS